MSKSNAFETALLGLIFNNAAITNIGDAGGLQPSAADGNLYVALHTANPDEAGDQTTSECAYGGYARVPVTRDGTGWTVTGNSVSPNANISFPEALSGIETATYASIGVASSGASMILYSGALTPSIDISAGIEPTIKTTSTITED
jgi:hypothetical protein